MMPRKRRFKNGYILWNAIAAVILIVSIVGYFWAASVRVVQGYWQADPFIILMHEIFHAALTATFIGWIVGTIIHKAKKR